jgi:ABC-type uncharacterized transport system permease subunit
MHNILLAGTAFAYLGAVLFLYFSITKSSPGLRKLATLATGAGLVLHSIVQYQHWLGNGLPVISILHVLSLCSLAIVALLMISLPLKKPLFDASLVALPIAITVVLMEWLIDVPGTHLNAGSPEITIHILSSIMAFGVLSVAGVYATFVALIDHFLHRHHLNPLVRTLPALDILESLLFQLITAGFALLTISLATGLMFVSDLFAQHLVHKTVLSIIAWMVFGTLLWGRWFRGWRGRVAVRMTLAGILLLLLSYFGSKLVLEIMLERSWQT